MGEQLNARLLRGLGILEAMANGLRELLSEGMLPEDYREEALVRLRASLAESQSMIDALVKRLPDQPASVKK